MTAFKKVWRYIRKYKKIFIISLIMLLLNQALGFLNPLIVKHILDEQILGVEKPWYEVEDKDKHTVEYKGTFYKQEKDFSPNEVKGNQVTVFLYKDKFYFVNQKIPTGVKTISGETLTIKGDSTTYTIEKLSYQEVLDFYAPMVKMLKLFLFFLLLSSLLSIVVSYVQRLTTAYININMTRDARLDALKKVQQLPVSYFENEPAGKTANRIISDVGGMMNLFGTLMNLVINASMSFIFAYIGMFYLDVKLALVTFVLTPIVYLWMRFFVRKLKQIAKKVNEQSSLITAFLNEIINGISILQIFNYKKQTAERFDHLNKDYMNNQINEVKLHTTLGWNMINLLRGIVTAAIILYFGSVYLNSPEIGITAGLIYAYNTYLLKVIDPISVLFTQISMLQHSMVRTERIFKLIDGEGEDDTKEVIPRYKGDIQFDNVWFSYNEKDFVLKGINFEIKAGQMIGLVGHTGSGKSSLMSLLLRFYDIKPTDIGKITIDGMDINTYSKQTYRQHIGIILQEPILFKGTIASNVRFGREDISDAVIEETLIKIGAKKLLDKFEKGIFQEVKRGGVNLSVGEKQLISFARALIYNPSVLIMDEATANIDTETEEMIQNALDVVSKNRTMIVIAHRLSTIKNADKIIVLESGINIEEGSHESLILKNGVYANIYRSQVKV